MRKRTLGRILSLAILAGLAATSHAATIVIDADDAAFDNQVLNTFFPGVTLSALNPTGSVFAVPYNFAITGTRVFGPQPNYPYFSPAGGQDFQAVFNFLAYSVSIDFVSDLGGTLFAFDSNGVLIATDTQTDFRGTFTVTAPGIKSIIVVLVKAAGNDAGTLDHLVINTIPDDAYLIRYASNLQIADSVVNITNTGANGAKLNGPGFGDPDGNICANVYTFSPDEQLISCCSCLVTPNALISLSVVNDLISNTLTGVRPNSVVVKLISTIGQNANAVTNPNCASSAATAGAAANPLVGGVLAWGTTLHAAPAPGSTFAVTETKFANATLSPGELNSVTNRCANIIGNGSSFGVCRSCRAGGLGGTRQ